jgi:hypothetical protein
VGDVLGQLEGAAEVALVDFEAVLGFGERCFGGGDLFLHSGALGAERVGGGILALFGVEADESLLLELERRDELCLGFADVAQGLLADIDVSTSIRLRSSERFGPWSTSLGQTVNARPVQTQRSRGQRHLPSA